MFEINSKDIFEFAKYFSLVHHTKGRIRLRISPEIKKIANKNANIDDLKTAIDSASKINGIKDIKFNPLVGSLTIKYDDTIFAEHLWNDFLEGKNSEKITNLLDSLLKGII